MADRDILIDISTKVGEMHGILNTWHSQCKTTHADVDKRLSSLEGKAIGLLITVIALLLPVLGYLIKITLGLPA